MKFPIRPNATLFPALVSKPGKRRLLGVFLTAFFGVPALRVAFTTPRPAAASLPPLSPEARKRTYRVYVARYQVHTTILVEQPDGWQLGPPGKENARFVEYGMGDVNVYRNSDWSPHVVFAAVFLGTPTAISVDGKDAPPKQTQGASFLYEGEATAEQVENLFTVLEQSMARHANGTRPAPLPPGRGTQGIYYPGREYYIFWSDCNHWTVERLHDANLANPGAGVIFAEQVPDRLKGFRRIY